MHYKTALVIVYENIEFISSHDILLLKIDGCHGKTKHSVRHS